MEWVDLRAAYQHVLEHEILPEISERNLLKKLKSGTLPAKANHLQDGLKEQTNVLLDVSFWQSQWAVLRIDFMNSLAENSYFTPNGKFTSVRRATGIAVSARHFFADWPETETPAAAKSREISTALPLKRGPRANVLPRVIAEMKKYDPEDLRQLTEESMSATFKASRDTCRKARLDVLSEFQSRQISTIDK